MAEATAKDPTTALKSARAALSDPGNVGVLILKKTIDQDKGVSFLDSLSRIWNSELAKAGDIIIKGFRSLKQMW